MRIKITVVEEGSTYHFSCPYHNTLIKITVVGGSENDTGIDKYGIAVVIGDSAVSGITLPASGGIGVRWHLRYVDVRRVTAGIGPCGV